MDSIYKAEAAGLITAGILAGGGSRRFGSDKAQAVWQGRTLLEWTIAGAETITNDINILTKKAMTPPSEGVSILIDHQTIPTPISGILSIMPMVNDWLLLLACDIPFFEAKVLELLWENRSRDKAVVIRINGKYQPFLGLYPANLLHHWEEAFQREEYHLQRIVEAMPKTILEEAELIFAGIDLHSFMNINTPADLARIDG